MRFLLTSLIFCCWALTTYAQETADGPVVTTEEGGDTSEVANVDSQKKEDKGGGCGCGSKPKLYRVR